jgi:DNA-binding NtrC family response regulator
VTALLLVEDEDDLAFGLGRLLQRDGYTVDRASGFQEALRLSAARLYDAVLLDLGLPDGDGYDLLERLKEPDGCPVIVQTGRDDAASAVRALRLGAADYLTKPVEKEALGHALRRVLEASAIKRALEAARRRPVDGPVALGSSPAWQRVLGEIRAAAAAERTPVLLQGESGTGKQVAAELLHAESPRAGGPFVAVNAACFSATLLDSELFGHEAGAFTDARSSRRGLLELASGGTLFLDEIAELPREIQPKLLRVLEGHPFRRVGGEREIRCDVRIVSASNRHLAEEVAAGRLRSDLYHRLRVVEIALPPLRERSEDVRELALEFLSRAAAQAGRGDLGFSVEAVACLMRHAWPGNVRELKNVVERAVIFAAGPAIVPQDLPSEVRAGDGDRIPAGSAVPRAPSAGAVEASLDEAVKRHILAAFAACGGNLTHAAERLRISRPTLRQHLRRYGVRRREA